MKNYFENVDRASIRAKADQMLDYANDARDYASRWSNHAVSRAQKFSILDFAVFKVCLLSLGLWLGSCFSKFFKKFRGVLFVLFAASWIYLVWQIFFNEEE